MEERQIEPATAVTGVGPAYQALLAEAQVDAAVRHGLSPALAARLVVETMAGTRRAARAQRTMTRSVSGARSPRPAARPRRAWQRSSAAACEQRSSRRSTRSVEWPVIDSRPSRASTSPTTSDTLFTVYILLIFVYILLNLVFSFGMRMPYSRWSDAILNFLRDVCEPYLRLFRRFIPPIGMFDLTPMIAIFVLYIVRTAHRQRDRGLSRRAATKCCCVAAPDEGSQPPRSPEPGCLLAGVSWPSTK